MGALRACTRKGCRWRMAWVQVGEGESIDSALRRFKREMIQGGVLEEVKRHERYEKPSEKRRRLLAAAIRRRNRRAARQR